jgi:signal peptidase II
VVGDVFILRYVENEGAFLSPTSRLPAPARVALFVAFLLAALAWLVTAIVRSSSLLWPLLSGLSIIAGGGFGNLIDRVFRGGHVSDFLNLGIGTFRTGIFNVADMAILTGSVLPRLPPPQSPCRDCCTRERSPADGMTPALRADAPLYGFP